MLTQNSGKHLNSLLLLVWTPHDFRNQYEKIWFYFQSLADLASGIKNNFDKNEIFLDGFTLYNGEII